MSAYSHPGTISYYFEVAHRDKFVMDLLKVSYITAGDLTLDENTQMKLSITSLVFLEPGMERTERLPKAD